MPDDVLHVQHICAIIVMAGERSGFFRAWNGVR